MGQVISLFDTRYAKHRARPSMVVVLDKSNLRERIIRQEKITRAYQNMVFQEAAKEGTNLDQALVFSKYVMECQHELDCMIAEYTGKYGALG